MKIKTVEDFRNVLKEGSFSSVGGYPIFYVCADNGVLCPACAKKEKKLVEAAIKGGRGFDNQWMVVAADVNYEDENLTCDHCEKQIPSAYGEDEVETKKNPTSTPIRFGEAVAPHSIELAKKHGDVTPSGISFGYDLCGGGAHFGLYIEDHHTEKDIEDAIKFLKHSRDVVSIVLRKVGKFFLVEKDDATPFKKDSGKEFCIGAYSSRKEAKDAMEEYNRHGYNAYVTDYDPQFKKNHTKNNPSKSSVREKAAKKLGEEKLNKVIGHLEKAARDNFSALDLVGWQAIGQQIVYGYERALGFSGSANMCGVVERGVKELKKKKAFTEENFVNLYVDAFLDELK